MTVTTQTNKVVISGNGVTTVFSYNFLVRDPVDVTVIYTDALGVSYTLSTSSYILTGVGNPTGGTVIYNPGGTPIATGTSLTIIRQMALTQPTSIANQGSFYPQTVEQAIDRAVMLTQQINEISGRFITGPITDPLPMANLPSAAQRANRGLAFDSSGNPIAGSLPASGIISSAMQPVVSAASIPMAKTALGLGAMASEGIGKGLQDDGTGNARINLTTEAKAANYLIASTDHMENYLVSGPVTFTLPATSTLWNGFGFYADVDSGTLTLTPNIADSIEGNTSGSSSYVPIASKAFIFTNGTGNWYINRFKTYSSATTPGGYITPVSGAPVIISDSISATTIYYTPYSSGLVPLYTGSEWIEFPFSELSCALNATQQTAITAHDVFVTLVSGAPTLVIGPAWHQAGYGNGGNGFTSLTNATPMVCTATGHGLSNGDVVYFSGALNDNGLSPASPSAANGSWVVSGVSGASFTLTGSAGTGTYLAGTGTFASRGVGAGTSQLARLGGINTNAVSMTAYNGTTPYTITAGQATYVGSIIIDSVAGQVTCHKSTGQSRKFGIWNAYNRKDIVIKVMDPTASWAYAGTSRQSNGSAANVLTAFIGLPEEPISYSFHQRVVAAASGFISIGIGLTSTTVRQGIFGYFPLSGTTTNMAIAESPPTIGQQLAVPMESSNVSTTFDGSDPYMLLTCKYKG